MTARTKSACIPLYLTAGICIIAGLIYLFLPGLMPYHIAFLGKSEAELDTQVLQLLIYAKKLIGGLVLTIGGILGIITWNIQSSPRWLILSLIWLTTVPMLVTAYVVANVTGIIPLTGIVVLAFLTLTGILIAAGD